MILLPFLFETILLLCFLDMTGARTTWQNDWQKKLVNALQARRFFYARNFSLKPFFAVARDIFLGVKIKGFALRSESIIFKRPRESRNSKQNVQNRMPTSFFIGTFLVYEKQTLLKYISSDQKMQFLYSCLETYLLAMNFKKKILSSKKTQHWCDMIKLIGQHDCQ